MSFTGERLDLSLMVGESQTMFSVWVMPLRIERKENSGWFFLNHSNVSVVQWWEVQF
jgi:hypothetical protein